MKRVTKHKTNVRHDNNNNNNKSIKKIVNKLTDAKADMKTKTMKKIYNKTNLTTKYKYQNRCSLPISDLTDDIIFNKVKQLATNVEPLPFIKSSALTYYEKDRPVQIDSPVDESFDITTVTSDDESVDEIVDNVNNQPQIVFMTTQAITDIAQNSNVMLGFDHKLDIAVSERIKTENNITPLAICDIPQHNKMIKLPSLSTCNTLAVTTPNDLTLVEYNKDGVITAPRLKIGNHICGPECIYERLTDVAELGTSQTHLSRLIKTGIIQNNTSDPSPYNIWVCMQGGVYHDCRQHTCKDQYPSNGYYMCSKTHVIHGKNTCGTDHMRHMFSGRTSHQIERVRDDKVAMAEILTMSDRCNMTKSASYNAPWKRMERENVLKKQKRSNTHQHEIHQHCIKETTSEVVDQSQLEKKKRKTYTVDLKNDDVDENISIKSVAIEAWIQNLIIALNNNESFTCPQSTFLSEMHIAAEKVISATLINGQSAIRQRNIIQGFSNLVMRAWFIVDMSRDIDASTNLMRVELSKFAVQLDQKLSDTTTVSIPPTTSSHERYFYQLWKVKGPRPYASNVHESDGKIKFCRFNKFKEIGIGTLFVASNGYESAADIMTLSIPRILIDRFAITLRHLYGSSGLIQFAEEHKIKILKKDIYLQKKLIPILLKRSYNNNNNNTLNKYNNTSPRINIIHIDSGSTAIMSRLSALVEWSKMKLLHDFFICSMNINDAIKNFDERNMAFAMN